MTSANAAAIGKQFPHFDSHANIPLLVWHPGFRAMVAA